MDKSRKLKHDMENATVAISRLTSSMQKPLARIFDFVESQSKPVVSERELVILKQSMQVLSKEADKLRDLFSLANINAK